MPYQKRKKAQEIKGQFDIIEDALKQEKQKRNELLFAIICHRHSLNNAENKYKNNGGSLEDYANEMIAASLTLYQVVDKAFE